MELQISIEEVKKIIDEIVDNQFVIKALNEARLTSKQMNEEDVEFAAEKLKVLHELEQLARPFQPYVANFMISLCYIVDHVPYVSTTLTKDTNSAYGDYYFESKKAADQAIEKIGRERIKKYLFGITEND